MSAAAGGAGAGAGAGAEAGDANIHISNEARDAAETLIALQSAPVASSASSLKSHTPVSLWEAISGAAFGNMYKELFGDSENIRPEYLIFNIKSSQNFPLALLNGTKAAYTTAYLETHPGRTRVPIAAEHAFFYQVYNPINDLPVSRMTIVDAAFLVTVHTLVTMAKGDSPTSPAAKALARDALQYGMNIYAKKRGGRRRKTHRRRMHRSARREHRHKTRQQRRR